jgi:hypothetical protein
MQQEKKYPIKWEYKSHSYQIGDTGDYDGYWEVSNGNDSLITKEDYEDIEKDLQAVVDLLNNTYANFTFDRGNEAALEAENRWLKSELEQCKAHPGSPVWVKAKDRFPTSWHLKCVRFIHTKAPLICPENWLDENPKAIEVVEWLDEETGQYNKDDAVGFAKWILENGIESTFNDHGKGWIDFSKPMGKNRFTTEQLYNEYQKQNKQC